MGTFVPESYNKRFCLGNGPPWSVYQTMMVLSRKPSSSSFLPYILCGLESPMRKRSISWRRKCNVRIPKSKKFYIAVNCTAWIPLNIYVIFVINIFVNPGTYIISGLVDKLLIWSGFHLSLLSMLYLTINTFRYYLNRQGRIAKELNNNSYGVYIIHVIVMGSIALTMLNTEIPSLWKYLILTVSTYAASNLIISFYRKVIK